MEKAGFKSIIPFDELQVMGKVGTAKTQKVA